MVCMGPLGCTVHFWEYSANQGDCIRVGSVYLSPLDHLTDKLGWQTALGTLKIRVSRRAGPQNGADRAVSSICDVADGAHDAEYSGFCTVQAGVRWGEKEYPRLFMHGTDENMQNLALCSRCCGRASGHDSRGGYSNGRGGKRGGGFRRPGDGNGKCR